MLSVKNLCSLHHEQNFVVARILMYSAMLVHLLAAGIKAL